MCALGGIRVSLVAEGRQNPERAKHQNSQEFPSQGGDVSLGSVKGGKTYLLVSLLRAGGCPFLLFSLLERKMRLGEAGGRWRGCCLRPSAGSAGQLGQAQHRLRL